LRIVVHGLEVGLRHSFLPNLRDDRLPAINANPRKAATPMPLAQGAATTTLMTKQGAEMPEDEKLASILPAELGGRPLIVFDGACVLCSGFARLVARLDRSQRFRFATAQSPLGESLFRHFGLPTDVYETNLGLIGGVGYLRMDSLVAVMRELGWPWKAATALNLLPRRSRDWLYARIAANRYALFGRKESCDVPSPGLRSRLIG
jgi:predicted DCC family thiol-disulfide oxidoreductase YuxK